MTKKEQILLVLQDIEHFLADANEGYLNEQMSLIGGSLDEIAEAVEKIYRILNVK